MSTQITLLANNFRELEAKIPKTPVQAPVLGGGIPSGVSPSTNPPLGGGFASQGPPPANATPEVTPQAQSTRSSPSRRSQVPLSRFPSFIPAGSTYIQEVFKNMGSQGVTPPQQDPRGGRDPKGPERHTLAGGSTKQRPGESHYEPSSQNINTPQGGPTGPSIYSLLRQVLAASTSTTTPMVFKVVFFLVILYPPVGNL